MLKSPEMTSSEAEVLRSSRSVQNSSRNTAVEVDGGRYMVRKVKEADAMDNLMQRDSNVVNVGIGMRAILR
jgi:hypothetical protein